MVASAVGTLRTCRRKMRSFRTSAQIRYILNGTETNAHHVPFARCAHFCHSSSVYGHCMHTLLCVFCAHVYVSDWNVFDAEPVFDVCITFVGSIEWDSIVRFARVEANKAQTDDFRTRWVRLEWNRMSVDSNVRTNVMRCDVWELSTRNCPTVGCSYSVLFSTGNFLRYGIPESNIIYYRLSMTHWTTVYHLSCWLPVIFAYSKHALAECYCNARSILFANCRPELMN